MRVLVVNAGSSSVKLNLIGPDSAMLASRELAAPHLQVDPGELRAALRAGLGEADAVGHRIVHGGRRYRAPVRIDAEVRAALDALTDLAPLHQPKSLAALDAVSAVLPAVPAVACFDTAFHATLPPAAFTYALPEEWIRRWGLRRYGFHGLSHAWVARRAAELVPRAESRRIISAHLGAGASLCAIRDGASIDTTMGFTPLEGLVMATRSGSVDPGLITWLLGRGELRAAELDEALENASGLLGLAGTADMREVLARATSGDERAATALEVYMHRLRAGIAAMAASLSGLDVLVFTGGVGQHSAPVRARAGAGLGFLGVTIDDTRNDAGEPPDRMIGGDGTPGGVRTLVIAAREDLEIAHQVRGLLRDS